MADVVASIAALPVPLSLKLRLLRGAAPWCGRRGEIVRFAADYPAVAVGRDWCPRAWWGAAAGEVVRAHLYDPRRRAAALGLAEEAGVVPLEEARREGRGVIVLTAHLGPPKFLMNWLVRRRLPLLVWTNTRDLPAWLAGEGEAEFVDPRRPDERGLALVRSALHLRRGGVLLGAADRATGDRTFEVERLGVPWRFSLGLPMLARQLQVPVVAGLALWHGNRVRVGFSPFPRPDPTLSEEDWIARWLEGYWGLIEPVLRDSPENLRFLRRAVRQVARPWEDTAG